MHYILLSFFKMLIYSFSGEMSVSFLDLEAAFPIVVTYSKIDGFPQITENNLGIGKIFFKHSEKANLF